MCEAAANDILSDDLIAVYCAQYLGQILVEGAVKQSSSDLLMRLNLPAHL